MLGPRRSALVEAAVAGRAADGQAADELFTDLFAPVEAAATERLSGAAERQVPPQIHASLVGEGQGLSAEARKGVDG